jgi:hypothetical protein
MREPQEIIKDYRKSKEDRLPLVALSRRRAEAFCIEYNLPTEEEELFFSLFDAFAEIGEENPLPLASANPDYRGAKLVSQEKAKDSLRWLHKAASKTKKLYTLPLRAYIEELFIHFTEEDAKEQAISLAAYYIKEGLTSWEQVYQGDIKGLELFKQDVEATLFCYYFVETAGRVKGSPIKSEKELQKITEGHHTRYLYQESIIGKDIDRGGLFHTAGLYRYREEIKRKMRRGATYKQLLAIKPSSFFLPSDLSTVDSVYNGKYYDEDKEEVVAEEMYAYKSKEEIVAAVMTTELFLEAPGWNTNIGHLVELFAPALGLSFEELLEIALTNDKW